MDVAKELLNKQINIRLDGNEVLIGRVTGLSANYDESSKEPIIEMDISALEKPRDLKKPWDSYAGVG